MFIRTIHQINGKISILIVENIRTKKKVHQKTLRHVATVPPEEFEMFKKVAEHIKAEMESEKELKTLKSKTLANTIISSRNNQTDTPLPVNLRKMLEECRIVTGIHDIYGSLYDIIGFTQAFKSCKKSERILKDIVMARLAKPCSKRSSHELLEKDFGIAIPLIKIYRMMDKITEGRIKQIQDLCYIHSKTLLTEITVMFYDCTTLYFESFKEDELRKFGFSKDHKFNQGQILLALMVTQEGLPIGYEIFPGNMNEGKTFKDAIEKVKNRYQVKKVVIVADSGLLSDDNMKLLEKEGYEYILGARLRSLTVEWQNKVLHRTEYIKVEKDDDDVLQITTYQYTKERKLIVTYSSRRAAKDRKDREKAIEKLIQKIEKSKKPQSLISNFGYKKYIKIDGNAKIEINESKLKKEALWDGLHGLFTNVKSKDMKVREIINQYHGLWQVKESFRINKHDLRMRPIFHWTANRIRAHIAICFIAFALIRFLQFKIKQQLQESLSAERIKKELYSIQESILKDTTNNRRYVIPSKPSQDARKIYEVMNKKRDVIPFKLMKN